MPQSGVAVLKLLRVFNHLFSKLYNHPSTHYMAPRFLISRAAFTSLEDINDWLNEVLMSSTAWPRTRELFTPQGRHLTSPQLTTMR